jgi:uncharacterized membrane protein
VELIASQAFLPIASGPALLVAVPLTAAHLLSTHDWEMSLLLHYGVLPAALLFTCTVAGIARLAASSRLAGLWRPLSARRLQAAVVLASLVLVAEVLAAYFNGPFGRRLQLSHYRQTSHSAAVREVLRLVPSDASVSAQSGLLPHLAQRRQAWEFPPAFGAQYVVIDRTEWFHVHGPPIPENDYHVALASLPYNGYCLLFAKDGAELWHLGHCPQQPGVSPENGAPSVRSPSDEFK